MNKTTIAAFDFDGTLINKDSFKEFAIFVLGKRRFLTGLLKNIHLLTAYMFGIYSNDKSKQALFSSFFKGMPHSQFADYGIRFATHLDTMLKPEQIERLNTHLSHGDKTYIISASIKEWIAPWAQSHGIGNVISTEIEVDDDGILTGRFSTPNCYGVEKVNRLLKIEPNRNNYTLYAYGDSAGDSQLLDFADEGFMVK